MNILVNTRLLIYGKLEGIGWFTYELLKRIVKNHPEHTFYFLFDRKYHSEFVFSSNVIPLVYGPPARHPFLYFVWFEFIVPYVIKKYNIDVFFSPDHMLSLKAKIPTLLVVHDLNFIHHPEFLPVSEALFYKYFVTRYIKKANRIVAVSNYTKNDIINTLNIDKTIIDVVYNAPTLTNNLTDKYDKQEIVKKYSDGKPYFIYIGSLHKRKNIDRIFKAFESFIEETKSNVNFIFVGKPMWKDKSIDSVYKSLKYKDKIIFTGYLDSVEATKLLASSLALVFVSLFEGFGIPIVEAMSLGVPVITSNVTSMPEIADDAALLVDPYSIEEIKEAMKKIYYDENLRAKLIQKGILRSKVFNWDVSAEKLWESILKLK
jgi:glycosyltransferase involved in cell wall biosynthesis